MPNYQLMQRRSLTVAFVSKIVEPGKYHDNRGLGLMLRVMESGSKQYVQRITYGGQRFEFGLGSPPVVTLASARDRALENKRSVHNGVDPREQKRARNAMPTFETAARQACEIQSRGKAKNYHVRFMGALEKHAFPLIGAKKVSDVSSKDIFNILSVSAETAPEVAKKLRNNLSVVIRWALSNDFLSEDPIPRAVAGLPKYTSSGKHRKSLPYALVYEFLEALKASNATSSTKLSLEFVILTAGRSGEIRGAVWDEVDFTERLWTIPADRMKMRLDHKVPLSDRALEVLNEAKALNPNSDIIFPSIRGMPLSDATMSKFVKQGLKYDVDVHGFRASFRTWTQERTECRNEAAELALAHAVGGKVEAAYARSEFLPERVKLLQDWADYLKVPSENHSSIKV